MKTIFVLMVLIFVLGWYSNFVYSHYSNIGLELPFGINASRNLSVPQDYIKPEDIEIQEDKIIITVADAAISKYANTDSMLPIIDYTANGLEIVPECSKIKVGDIIAYEAAWTDATVVHRVVEVIEGNQGRYFLLKGDSSPFKDPEPVSCAQVKYQLIGVLY